LNFLTERLGTLMRIPFDWEAVDPAVSHHSISRITLRRVLLDGLDDVVRFDKRFARFEDAPDGRVVAHFEDGTSAVGDVLVGADGGNSRVRKQLLPHAQRIDTGVVGLGGKVPLDEESRRWIPAPFLEGPTIVMGPGGKAMFGAPLEYRDGADANMIGIDDGAAALQPGLLFDNARDYVLCAFSARRSAFPEGVDIDAIEGPALRDVILGMMEGWHPGLRRLVAEADPSTFSVLPIRTSVPVDPWPSRNVTLLGDAIHSMTPFRGIGANVALRDAAGLARRLIAVDRGEAPLLGSIHEYEADMLGYAFKSVRESLRAMEQIHETNPISKADIKTLYRSLNVVFSLKRRATHRRARIHV
jgi:2-polyprenyl-6-methoxyphenol hydroxylase-like FAD-dependent oxidoreductase